MIDGSHTDSEDFTSPGEMEWEIFATSSSSESGSSKDLSKVLDTCENCHAVDPLSGNRDVSLSSMSRGFNEVVCVDHVHLGGHTVFHAMDSVTRYSAGELVPSTGLADAVAAFQGC